MAENGASTEDRDGPEAERKPGRSRVRGREQRMPRSAEDRKLPAPPPDPWTVAGCPPRVTRHRNHVEEQQEEEVEEEEEEEEVEEEQEVVEEEEEEEEEEQEEVEEEEEEEDIIAYLTELGTPPFEGQTSESPSRNSGASTMPVSGLCTEEAFEQLDRLYALAEQILDLRRRSTGLFKRVRELERLKVLRNSHNRLETAFARNNGRLLDYTEEDTGFAESLLDAMLSNCRDPQPQRLNLRSPSSRQRSRSLVLAEQSPPPLPRRVANRLDLDRRLDRSRDRDRTGGPKISKWTRVKAAFKWERACPNDLAEPMEQATPTTPSTPTGKYLRIPDGGTGNWSGSTLSPTVSEFSGPSTPFGRVSSASSSNEGSCDGPRRNADRQSLRTKEERRKEDVTVKRRSRSLDGDTIVTDTTLDDPERTTERKELGTPVIRITGENNSAVEKRSREKRPTPTLTISIPRNEDEIRGVSSPESVSPLPSSAYNSGGNSLQQARDQRRTTADEPMTPNPKMQRQDSKWNKVRRAFLTNSAFSVPPSPVKVISGQSFLRDDPDTPKVRSCSCSGSVENLEKGAIGTNRANQPDARRDYQALREKLGAEFHRKLVEWERLKGSSTRAASRNASSGTPNLRDGPLLPEERLPPEFKKKLQEWKRAKKSRRGSASTEQQQQQRASKRRLTDWQLWRSPSKPDGRSQDAFGSRVSCGSGGSVVSVVSDGRPHLCEDFVRRMEAWRRMNEVHRVTEPTKLSSPGNRLGASGSGIDEDEFIALEKVLLLFGDRVGRERRESDAKQLEECFDGDTRMWLMNVQYVDGLKNSDLEILIIKMNDAGDLRKLDNEQLKAVVEANPCETTRELVARLADGPQSVSFGNEVLIRTSVGSYRFEGISREFTRKLYDWEKYRGISPRSSTFRLLAPGYVPFAGEETAQTETPSTTTTNIADEGKPFSGMPKRRSKSVGSIVQETARTERYTRRSGSLQSLARLANRLEQDRVDASPAPIESQRRVDASEDTAIDDSEPEAMIVDIEDVIEETASPLKRVQPHQTPVYSVAASETTSIAVPLGTVASSHEPSPVFLVEVEENEGQDRWPNSRTWGQRKNGSSEVSPDRSEETTLWDQREDSIDRISIGSDRSVTSIEWHEASQSCAFDQSQDQIGIESEREEEEAEPSESSDGESTVKNGPKLEPLGKEEAEIARLTHEIRKPVTLPEDTKGSMDLPGVTNRERDEPGRDDSEGDVVDENRHGEFQPITNTVDTCDSSAVGNRLDGRPIVAPFVKPFEKFAISDNGEETFDTNHIAEQPIQEEVADHRTTSSVFEQRETSRRYDQDCDTLRFARCVTSSSSSSTEYRRETTVRTTPLTVTSCREERCYERIIINESTLNKIVVPTACTGEAKPLPRSGEESSSDNSSEGQATNETARKRETSPKKTVSPGRNVFVKTKRMIFSPFWRTEHRFPGNRKGSNGSDEDRTPRAKSKSKSRSSSPKWSRQDVLLRMPLSLPWPLRSSSRDPELRSRTFFERKRYNGGRKTKSEERRDNDCKSSEQDVPLVPVQPEEPNGDKSDRPTTGSSLNQSSHRREMDRASVSVQARRDTETRGQLSIRGSPLGSPWLANRATDVETLLSPSSASSSANNSPIPSADLMHKLKILSNVAARRYSESNAASLESTLESHSSRIRRAKESFLSRRGGPLCYSVSEPRGFEASEREPTRPLTNYYEPVQVQRDFQDGGEGSANTKEGGDGASTEQPNSRTEQDRKSRTYLETGADVSQAAASSRPDLVKSASAGMIHVDPDTFGRLAEQQSSRGCESLPRASSRRKESPGPFAKIVSKFKLSRLIRGRDPEENSMSTISRLCRQSLLIDVQSDFEEQENEDQEGQEECSRRDTRSNDNAGNPKK